MKNNIEEIIKYIIDVHKELHGTGIVDFAIIDDVMRKTKYQYNKEEIIKLVHKIILN